MDTVLVVDDNPTSVEVLGYLLESKGYSVLRAESAAEAENVSKLHKGPISLLVTDAALRSVTGQELATRIRAARPELQILYISGYTSVHLITAGELKWNAPFLQKPFSGDVFLKTVGDLLGKGRGENESAEDPR